MFLLHIQFVIVQSIKFFDQKYLNFFQMKQSNWRGIQRTTEAMYIMFLQYANDILIALGFSEKSFSLRSSVLFSHVNIFLLLLFFDI